VWDAHCALTPIIFETSDSDGTPAYEGSSWATETVELADEFLAEDFKLKFNIVPHRQKAASHVQAVSRPASCARTKGG
jgi:hypothetical protein